MGEGCLCPRLCCVDCGSHFGSHCPWRRGREHTRVPWSGQAQRRAFPCRWERGTACGRVETSPRRVPTSWEGLSRRGGGRPGGAADGGPGALTEPRPGSSLQVEVIKKAYLQGEGEEEPEEGENEENGEDGAASPRIVGHNIYILAHQVRPPPSLPGPSPRAPLLPGVTPLCWLCPCRGFLGAKGRLAEC